MRPDEEAAMAEIEREKRHGKRLNKAAESAIGLGATVGIGSKILPFLNEYIPADLAIKGISKISPDLGAFLKKGRDKGLNLKDGLDFIKNQVNKKSESDESQIPKKGNIIRQYSDILDEFVKSEISKGRSPVEAGALAQLETKFKPVIKKMEKDHNANWSSILESVYGSEMQPKQAPSEPMAAPQQAQSGGMQPDLMQAMQRLQQALKG